LKFKITIMDYYRIKPVVVAAVQYGGGDVKVDGVTDRGELYAGMRHIEIGERHEVMELGDWLVRDVDGKYSVLRDKEFCAKYELAGPDKA